MTMMEDSINALNAQKGDRDVEVKALDGMAWRLSYLFQMQGLVAMCTLLFFVVLCLFQVADLDSVQDEALPSYEAGRKS
jgi:hypothetical protein